MKNKTVCVLLLALCLCVTAACAADGTPQQEPTSEPLPSAEATETAEAPEQTEQPAADDSGTDLVMPGEEGFVDDSGTDIPTPPDEGWTGLTAEECVEDALPEAGVLPRIILECEGAQTINEQLESQFAPLAEDPECEGMHYECYKGAERVLSLLMTVYGPNDTVFYTPFNLDLTTGQALSGGELLQLLDVDADKLSNLEQAVMGEEFTHQFGTLKDQMDEDFYNEQYIRTTDPENVETERLWLGGDGQLYFVGRIYSMAGAEFYEYILGTTLYF